MLYYITLHLLYIVYLIISIVYNMFQSTDSFRLVNKENGNEVEFITKKKELTQNWVHSINTAV